MKAIVFAGPSLIGPPPDDPRIEIAPPAVAGDVHVAVEQGATIVGLIDARFENEQTVRHDELVHALHRGVHVLGAASMGALRAVECAPFGMRGLGRIFQMFRDGEIDGDHEVAVQFGPADLGWPDLSVPLVNVRISLEHAVETARLTEVEASEILRVAFAQYYKDLTWEAVQADLADPVLRAKLAAFISDGYVNQKAQDARGLLETIQELVAVDPPPFAPPFNFIPTLFWDAFTAELTYRTRRSDGPDSDVLDELRLDPVRFSDVRERSFARQTVAADTHASTQTPLLDAFRADLGLMTRQSFQDWLVANRTDEVRLLRFLEDDATLEQRLEDTAPLLEKEMLDELRGDDQFIALDARATEKRNILQGRTAANVPVAFADFDLNDLLDWFCRSRRLTADFENPDDAARSLGLPDRKALHVLLRREFEYVQTMNGEGD